MNDLLLIAQALDPLFPIGSFTLSNGMETYVQREIVRDEPSLRSLLTAYLYTLPTGDMGFAARAAIGDDVRELDELYSASRSPYELRSGSEKLCRRFLKAQLCLGNYPLLSDYLRMIQSGECTGSHPIAIGLFIRETGAEISEALALYGYSLLSAMVNHAVKLVPLRQLDGQKALSDVMNDIPSAVKKALEIKKDDLGIGGSGFELRSMQHEKLFTRIYIS